MRYKVFRNPSETAHQAQNVDRLLGEPIGGLCVGNEEIYQMH